MTSSRVRRGFDWPTQAKAQKLPLFPECGNMYDTSLQKLLAQSVCDLRGARFTLHSWKHVWSSALSKDHSPRVLLHGCADVRISLCHRAYADSDAAFSNMPQRR